MSNAAHISGQNAPFTLPHSPALRGCNHCVVADAFTSSLHVSQHGDSALWMPSVGRHEKTFDDAIHEGCVSVVSPLLVRSHASGHVMRPAALGLLLRLRRPSGHGSSRNKFAHRGQERRANFFRVPPRKQPVGAWEHGPLAQAPPMGDPANPGIQP